MQKVILASASPRRRELLGWILPEYEVIPSAVEEILPEGIPACKQAEYLADLKASDIYKKHPDAMVIGSDTTVVCDEVVLGKPRDAEEAASMLKMLSGRVHKVITGCAIYYKNRKRVWSGEADVEFYNLTDAEIDAYIRENEFQDKAGAYGIQSKGALLIRGIRGDYYSVVGLPVAQLKREIEGMLNDE